MVEKKNSKDEIKESKTSKTLVVTIFLLIPLLAISAIFLVLAHFSDINVFDKAKELTAKLPFGDEVLGDIEKTSNVRYDEQVVTLQADIQEKEAQLVNLEKELAVSTEEKEQLLLKQEELHYEIEVLKRGKDDSKRKFTEVVTTFEKMSAKSAAPILNEMSDEEAIQILKNLKTDMLASILEKMSPKDAARYTSMLAN